jgi:hypothetical protein
MVRIVRNLLRDGKRGVKIERERIRFGPSCSEDTTRSSRFDDLTVEVMAEKGNSVQMTKWNGCRYINHETISSHQPLQIYEL